MSRILLVEDNAANRKLARYILEQAGHEVLEALTGIEGVDMANAHRPDLIIMDVQLPDLDGLSATRAIRREPHGVSVPIIAVTACAMPGDRERVLKAGCDGYLAKPIRYKTLMQLVDEMLHKETGHDAR